MKTTLDRIEEGTAVLLIRPEEKETVYLPAQYLPENVQEGDILNLQIKLNKEETKNAKQRVRNLLNRLQEKDEGGRH